MKAKEMLKWIVDFQISLEDVQFIEIDDTNEFQSQSEFLEVFFGCEPPTKKIPFGDYIYFYSDLLDEDEINFQQIAQKAEIVLKADDVRIYLFKIDD